MRNLENEEKVEKVEIGEYSMLSTILYQVVDENMIGIWRELGGKNSKTVEKKKVRKE